jgi:methionine salvage enolase-phosphatase E1
MAVNPILVFYSNDVIDYDPSFLKVDSKFDVKGYEKIKSETGVEHWTFFSDVPAEVDGSKKAGMKGYVVVREGNKPLTPSERQVHNILENGFGDIVDLTKS